MTRRWLALPWLLLAFGCQGRPAPSVRIGSKQFTESVLLGEMVRALAEASGRRAEHRKELGGTRVVWGALLHDEIDVYPEYTGTLLREILAREQLNDNTLSARLATYGVRMGRPLGFSNGYALGMNEARARALGIECVSDLKRHPELRFGLTSEFMDRGDGWPGLRARYGLAAAWVRGLDHDLAYRGLAQGDIDVTDLYTTDAEIPQYGLRLLRDDLGYFPEYQAVLLYREAFVRKQPALFAQLERLGGALDTNAMQRLNAAVKLQGKTEAEVSARFLARHLKLETSTARTSRARELFGYAVDHLTLVAVSLALAVLCAIPLGICAARYRRFGQLILTAVGVLQTIPSLALLVFMIPWLGIGANTAIAALFLYSLLPIVRNTHAGLTNIAGSTIESAEALGLPRGARLRLIELPLATPAILAGIKTAAVINVGTATLGALIGAGGFGQPILTGIRLADYGLILEGAIPAALLALAVQALFDACERWLVPRGLRL